jgi:WD40 repeat protein
MQTPTVPLALGKKKLVQKYKSRKPCDNQKMRNLRLVYLLAALSLLAACSPQAQTPAIATSTDIQNPTATLAPATAIPPSPTPNLVPISASTVDRLAVFMSFGRGEILRSLAFSPDGSALASAGGNSEDFDIRLWDVASGQQLQTFQGHTGIVWMVAFSPDSSKLASASSDSTVKIWDWVNGTQIQSLDFPNEMISVGFSPDSLTLAAGGVFEWPDAAIWTYTVANWQRVLLLFEFWNIPDLVYSQDGELIFGGGTSRNVRIWRTSDGAELHTLYHSGQVTSMDLSSDGATLAIGLCEASDANSQCTRGAVWLWDWQNEVVLRKLSDFSTWVNAVAYTPDGSVLIAGSRDGTLKAYSTADFSTLHNFSSPGGEGIFAISHDGGLLATLGSDGAINMWKVSP